jgi:hypothetical protein
MNLLILSTLLTGFVKFKSLSKRFIFGGCKFDINFKFNI